MIDENASTDDAVTGSERTDQDQSAQQSAPPARRRSRRATSAVTTPKHEAPVPSARSSDLPGSAAGNETAGTEGAASARADDAADGAADKSTGKAKGSGARRTKAPAATSAPQDGSPADQQGTEEATGAKSGSKKSGSPQAGSKKPTTTRARTKKTSRDQEPESADTPEQGSGVDDAATAGQGSEQAEGKQAEDKQTRRKRTVAKKDGAPQQDAAEQAASSGSDEAEATSKPRLATTALLFQPPEPSRPRRRAQAPAGPPRPEEVDEDDETTDPSDETTPQADDESQADAAGEAEDGTTEDEDENDADGDGEGHEGAPRRRRRRGGRGRRGRSGSGGSNGQDGPSADSDGDGEDGSATVQTDQSADEADGGDSNGDSGSGEGSSSSRRRRRRRRGSRGDSSDGNGNGRSRSSRDEVTALKGSTRLEAKRQRRREGRDAGRRRTIVTESEFLARRESVERSMIVRESDGRVQIAVLEDGVLVEHFVSRSAQNGQASMAGNVYLGRVQNVLPSMEAAFIDVGKGRNAVLYAGEVNWDAAGMEGQPRRIEQALKSGDSVLVQVTKDPIGHKGARLTSQITLAGRYLVYVPGGGMTGISRKLPENERARLKKILREVVPDAAGVIVRTAAEGASEEELRNDVQRLQDQWAAIEKKSKTASAPALLQGEPDLAIRVVRDIFNDDFGSLVVAGDGAWSMISEYVQAMAPDLMEKVSRWEGDGDVFAEHRIDEQLAKGMDRKVWLPSGGSLVIDRTEAMTVVDVNTGKFTGSGGTLEETVTRNNLEAAEEIVRQLRLRDIGGIIVIDFIDMVLESNRDLVLRRLVECLGRDRTKHQVAEVTSLGLVQMTRKRVGQGLVEAFSEPCAHCHGRGFIVHSEPVDPKGPSGDDGGSDGQSKRSRRKKSGTPSSAGVPVLPEARESVKATLATIAAAAAQAHEHGAEPTVAVMTEAEVTAGVETEVAADVAVQAAAADAGAETGADAEVETGAGAETGPVPPAASTTVDLPAGGEVARPVPDHAALADLADSLRSVVAGREAAVGGGQTDATAEENPATEQREVEQTEAEGSVEAAGESGAPHEGDTLI